MVAKALFDAGKVTDAIAALGAHLRDHPADSTQRIFLFELLCFAGQYARAEKQLAVLAQKSQEAELGATLYYSALHAEKMRQEMFEKQTFPTGTKCSPDLSGKINGKPFQSITDIDPDIGPRLELYAAGAYMWLPLEQIASIRIEPPTKLRDLLWTSAFVSTKSTFKGEDLGEVLIPVIYPLTWQLPNEQAWLGRVTEWGEDDQGVEHPCGQKMFLVDGEEIPLLDIRTIEFDEAGAAAAD